ncbi:LysE family translocator [Pedobacter sp. B4-66]|uniref:LysE family translocator n=1 Tax=Pedobacter sp. B4-66 TaxID=2817280 RepID=UPI001BDACF2E|nr:LysE family translocator [Pedobacter sp. B4-66]
MEILSFAIIIGSLALGTVSPGPSFIMIAKTALGKTRKDGIFASFGMGTGAVIFAGLSLGGLQLLFSAIPLLYSALKIIGGCYLCYMAWKTWLSRNDFAFTMGQHIAGENRQQLLGSFYTGLLTQLSNPKTAIVYTSIFASLMPKNYTFQDAAVLLTCIFLLETCWYTFVSLVLSHPIPRTIYLKAKSSIDKVTAGILAGLGISVILSD